MYQFSRAIYREISPRIIDGSGECARRQHVLDACESTMQRLLTDRRYFAKPTKALFSDLRNHFPIGEQLFVYRVVDRNVRLALQYLDTVPIEELDAGRDRASAARTPAAARPVSASRCRVGTTAPRTSTSKRTWTSTCRSWPDWPSASRERPSHPSMGALRDVRRQTVDNRSMLLGVDVGGTFTDAVLSTPMAARSRSAKAPTTPADQSEGVIAALRAVLERAGAEAGRRRAFRPRDDRRAPTPCSSGGAHERRWSRTEGFTDLLEIARQDRVEPLPPLPRPARAAGAIGAARRGARADRPRRGRSTR